MKPNRAADGSEDESDIVLAIGVTKLIALLSNTYADLPF